MKRLEYCYHTHTSRCGHATGLDEEYVIKAIEYGIKRLGFSDHVIFPKGYEQVGTRGSYYQLDDYIKSINSLKEKYKDKIEIHLGFEAEYMPQMMPYYKKLLDDKVVEYFILGQHCRLDNNKICWYNYPSALSQYVDEVLEGMSTGIFRYLAHPDLFMWAFPHMDEYVEKEARRLLKGCEEHNVILEININGMNRKTYNEEGNNYPTGKFYEIAREYNVKFVMGVDAHSPESFSDDFINKGSDFVKRHKIPIIEDYDMFK